MNFFSHQLKNNPNNQLRFSDATRLSYTKNLLWLNLIWCFFFKVHLNDCRKHFSNTQNTPRRTSFDKNLTPLKYRQEIARTSNCKFEHVTETGNILKGCILAVDKKYVHGLRGSSGSGSKQATLYISGTQTSRWIPEIYNRSKLRKIRRSESRWMCVTSSLKHNFDNASSLKDYNENVIRRIREK